MWQWGQKVNLWKSLIQIELCIYIQFRKCQNNDHFESSDFTNYSFKNNNRPSRFISKSSLFPIFPTATLKLLSHTPTSRIKDSVSSEAFVLMFHFEFAHLTLSWVTPSLAKWGGYSIHWSVTTSKPVTDFNVVVNGVCVYVCVYCV